MHPMLIVAIPIVLVIVGMVLNSIGLSFDQPPSSAEQDPAKRSAAEREDYRRFFDLQRSRAVTRQKRIGQYAWLLIVAILHLAVYVYREENHRCDSNCRASDTGDGRRKRDGSLGHAERRKQCQIPDQIIQSRYRGCRHERRNFKTEGLILRHGTIRYDLEYRRESLASRRRTESVQ